jgi:hypothetical protein
MRTTFADEPSIAAKSCRAFVAVTRPIDGISARHGFPQARKFSLLLSCLLMSVSSTNLRYQFPLYKCCNTGNEMTAGQASYKMYEVTKRLFWEGGSSSQDARKRGTAHVEKRERRRKKEQGQQMNTGQQHSRPKYKLLYRHAANDKANKSCLVGIIRPFILWLLCTQ